MTPEHTIKKGDRLPAVSGQLLAANGLPQPLGAATVRFHMWTARGVLKIDQPATVVDAPTGKVRYNWLAGDTDNAGTYHFEFEADFGGGVKLSFPNDEHGRVVITRTHI